MTMSWKLLVSGVTLVGIQASIAFARPGFGSDCTSCHTRTAGAFSFIPSSLLQVPMGQTRGFSINVTSTGGGTSALSLTGLDASGLAATADAWTDRGTWWTLGPFSGTGQKALNLSVPAGATRGSYSINVTLAGGAEDWSNTGSFTVKVGVPGDYNDNGAVDAADYVLWRKGGSLQFEVDNPGTVNAADYTAWRARFGKTTAGSGSGALLITTIPEPTALVLAVAGLVVEPLCRRKRR